MQQTQRIILYILLLISGAAWIVLNQSDSTGDSNDGTIAPQAGFRAPDFTLRAMDGVSVTLSDLGGQAALVNLWATWCPPCRAEMPAIEKMYQEYKDQGFIVLAVDMTYQDDPGEVGPFASKLGLTFPILLDETGELAGKYQLRSLPSSFFINRFGIITEVVVGGPMSEALLRARIEESLK